MTLYIVATPIGNWDDITLRAVNTLRDADVIACEDTRETGKLLEQIGVAGKKLLSYHAQSSSNREDEILERLASGETVALVADRGTPGISDPGSRLIARAIEAGAQVIPLPGASALITALMAAGVDTTRFEYLGFLPHKKGRQTLFTYISAAKHTVIFYESPHRLLKTLEALRAPELGLGSRRVVVCRELTKTYEEFVRGTAEDVFVEFSGRPSIKGEFVIIVDAA